MEEEEDRLFEFGEVRREEVVPKSWGVLLGRFPTRDEQQWKDGGSGLSKNRRHMRSSRL